MAKRKKKAGHRPGLFPSRSASRASAKRQADAAGAWDELRKLPTQALISTIDQMVGILRERGVVIRDWDEKDKAIQRVRLIGGKAYILAPREKPRTEVPTHDEDGERCPGG